MFDPPRKLIVMRHTSRKADFMLTVLALLVLWGPGMTRSRGFAAAPARTPRTSTVQEAVALESPCFPDRFPEPAALTGSYEDYAMVSVTITGYSSTVEQTDDTPEITATNTNVREGVIALSQDLLTEFTPGAPFSFHDRVEIPGLGRFFIEDTMHERWMRRADVWFPSREEALQWGLRTRRLYKLPDHEVRSFPLPGPREVAATFGSANFL
jgi:3D (Asp-Asp-Asp) domain-containing protein